MDTTEKPLILIVDDDELLAKSIQAVLEESGYRTHMVFNGEDAEEFLLETKPALITLDIEMPGISGIDLLVHFKDTQILEGVKIILLSGMPIDQLMMGVVGGADWVLEKPVDFNDVAAKVNDLLGK